MDDFSICRTCLDKKSLNPIFCNQREHSQYSKTIYIVLGLKIKFNDGLPQSMCTTCIMFLNECLKFRRKCKDSENALLNMKKKLKLKKDSSRMDERSEQIQTEKPNDEDNENDEANDNGNASKEIVQINENDEYLENLLDDDDKNGKCEGNEIAVLNEHGKGNEIGENNQNNDEYVINTYNGNNENIEMFTGSVDREVRSDPTSEFEDNTIQQGYMFDNNKDSDNMEQYNQNAIVYVTGYPYNMVQSQENIPRDNNLLIPSTEHQQVEEKQNAFLPDDKDLSSQIIELCKVEETSNNAFLPEDNNLSIPLTKHHKVKVKNKNVFDTNKASGPESKKNKDNVLIKDGKARVSCRFCHKELSTRSIDTHVTTRHPGSDGSRVKCDLCDSHITKAKLNRHTILMHDASNFKCAYCKVNFGKRETLIEHVATCAGKKRKKRPSEVSREFVECDICRKAMLKTSLLMHVKLKHKGLSPVCEHCGRRFSNKLRLNEHYRAKHDYEKFKCSYCKFQSSGITSLRNHERRHVGHKPYSCGACGAAFHAAYLLAQHRHSHRAEKTVKCDKCPAMFKAKNSLHTHKMTCHGSAVFRCGVCDRSYRCRHYAVKHLRQVHGYMGAVPPIRTDVEYETH